MNTSPERTIRKFNPGTFQSDEELNRQFVVRERELGIVLEVLRGNVDAPSCQHILLVAPRGQGKTMLLARVAAELRTSQEFSERLLPVRFMEESQEIFNLGDFWLETLFHLTREIGKSDPESAQEIRDTYADLTARWRGEELEGQARAAALDAADRLGKQIVLMIENLQTLCGDVDDDFGWKLRKTLQSEPQIILLATATSRFKGLDDAREPFFELFRIIRLDPLDTEECRCLWQAVSGDTVSEREIKPLKILTGGNPRLLVIVAGFAQHRSLRQLMENLVSLIDDHTEYFRSHLEGFAKTERRVYLSVIDLWQPSSTGEIAARARLDVRPVSTLLGRLVNRGAITVEGSGKKRLYAAAERLYSIYYKLRRDRDEAAVVRNLIYFMIVFYSDDELAEMSDKWIAEAEQFPAIREGIDLAVAEMPQIGDLLFGMMRSEKESAQPMIVTDKMLRQAARKMTAALEKGEFRKIIEIVDRYFGSQQSDSSRISNAKTALMIFIKAYAHSELGNSEKAVAVYDEVIERFGNHSALNVQSTIVKALMNKGYQQGLLGEAEAEIEIYGEIVERFGDSDATELQEQAAKALFNKAVTRGQLGDVEAELETYGEVVERFGDSDVPEIQKQVAAALVNKGVARGQLGEIEAEITLYDEVVKCFGDSDVPELQEQVAKALFNKGKVQIDLRHTMEALNTSEELERKYGTLTDDDAITFEWRARWIQMKVFLAQGKHLDSMKTFSSIYSAFVPGNRIMMRHILDHVLALMAAGASERDLVDILSGDNRKSDALEPLVVALRQRIGETVRAPVEVLEIAQDIRQRIEEM